MSNNNMTYIANDSASNNESSGISPPKKEVPKVYENVRKADVIITFLSKEHDKDTKEINTRVRGIKTTVFGFIEYTTYNNQYNTKDVMKKLEMIFNPFDKSFEMGFIGVPLSDGRFKFIAKSSIIDIDVQIEDFNEEVDESKIKKYPGQFDNYHR